MKESNGDEQNYPLVRRRSMFSRREWRKVVGLLDGSAEELGCPDWVDGEAEWIEIRRNEKMKRMTFEFGETIESLEDLLEEIGRVERKNFIQ